MLHDLLAKMAQAFTKTLHDITTQNHVTEAALAELLPLAQLDAAGSLSVYQRNLEGSLRKALQEIFPVCAALVGEECFHAIVRRYGDAEPSRHPDLARRGDAFPAFVQTLDFLKTTPYLPDMARLELAWHRALTAPDPPPLSESAALALAKIVAQYPAQWRFALPPSAQCIGSPYPILQIWHAHQRDAMSDLGPESDQHKIESKLREIQFDQEPDRLLIWRRALALRIDRVEAQFWPLLVAIEAGSSIAELLELAAEAQDTVQDEIEEAEASEFEPILNLFRELFARGWIAGCTELAR